MTDNVDLTDEAQAAELQSMEQYMRPDGVVGFLQGMANDVGIGLAVTLNVGGTVVSGSMISGRAFFAEQARRVRDAAVDPARHEADHIRTHLGIFADAVLGLGDGYRDFDVPVDDDNKGDERPVSFVHLNNAVIHTPGGPMDVGWWRGRVSSIDGWSLIDSTPSA